MYCNKCGAKILDNSSFCNKCGNKIEQVSTKTLNNEEQDKIYAQQSGIKKEQNLLRKKLLYGLYVQYYLRGYCYQYTL